MLKLFFYSFFLIPFVAFSQNNACPRENSCFCPYRYIGVEFGGSWSMKSGIKTDPSSWDPAKQGYNANLGKTPIYGFIFGYHFIDFFRADIHYQYRPSFTYEKEQENISGAGDKIRNFDLENIAIMFNGYLQASGLSCLGCFNLCGIVIDPFIMGGVGISYNTISSFYSESLDFPGEIFSMMADKQTSAFSWQAGIGLDFRFCCSTISLGYRYFYGGEFKSNDYLLDDPDGTTMKFQGITAPVWKGKVKANEFFATIRYPF